MRGDVEAAVALLEDPAEALRGAEIDLHNAVTEVMRVAVRGSPASVASALGFLERAHEQWLTWVSEARKTGARPG